MRIGVISFILAASFSAMPAFSEEFGTIDVKYDGEDRRWYTISQSSGGKTVATAEVSQSNQMSDIHIQGHPRPSYTSKDVLSIDLLYFGELNIDASPMSVEVTHLPDGMSGEIWVSDQSPQATKVRFEVFDLSGDIGRLSGTIDARLCLKATITSEPDPSNCKDISGTFETNVLNE